MKFECKGYADCCKNLRKGASPERLEKFSSVNVLNLATDPGNIALPVFDWEAGKIRAHAGDRYVSLRPLWIATDYKDRTIVIMWNLDHDNCPFLEGSDCSIYGDRPSICRSFPVTSSGLISVTKGGSSVKIGSSIACRCWSEQIPDMGSMSVEGMYAKFYEIFGDTYLGALKYDMQFVLAARIVQDLVNSGKIKPVYMDVKRAEKAVAKGCMGFVDFLAMEKIMTRGDIDRKLSGMEETARKLVGRA